MPTGTAAARGKSHAPRPNRKLQKALASQEATDKLPDDLAAAGWKLVEHAGPDQDKFMCENRRLKLTTLPLASPQSAFRQARVKQREYEEENPGARADASADGPQGRVVSGPVFRRPLKYPLTEEGKVRIADQLAPALNLLADAKRVREAAAADEKLKQKEVARLEEMLTTGEEEREGDCHEIFDYGAKTVRTVRSDTLADIEDPRAMTGTELQMPLVAP